MRYFIYNYSNCEGGQEKYIDYLAAEFKKDKKELKIIKKKPNLKNFLLPHNYPYKLSKKEKIIEILNGNAALYFRAALIRNKNVKKIYIQHSYYLDHQSGGFKVFIRLIIFSLLLKAISKIIRVSDSVLPEKFSKRKIFTIYNGVPEDNLKFQNIIPTEFNHVELIMIGAINNNKNQKLAINLLRENSKLKLTLLGDGNLKNYLLKKNKDLVNSGRLVFKGYIKDIRKYYLKSHVLLSLSFFEGMPFSILEAMSYGLPVIATNVGGINELINDMQNGIIIEPNDLKSLKKTILNLTSDLNLYERISANSRKTIRDRFTSKIMYDNLMKIINE